MYVLTNFQKKSFLRALWFFKMITLPRARRNLPIFFGIEFIKIDLSGRNMSLFENRKSGKSLHPNRQPASHVVPCVRGHSGGKLSCLWRHQGWGRIAHFVRCEEHFVLVGTHAFIAALEKLLHLQYYRVNSNSLKKMRSGKTAQWVMTNHAT